MTAARRPAVAGAVIGGPADDDVSVDVDAVLAWAVPQLRDLPWRRTREPWAILVSEVMLQQTQVARVVPAWTRFLGRFPTPEACASATLGDVLREWQGLGYPRRARHLHLAAGEIAERGGFPTDLSGMLGLPGVGPYTARAVLSFAFGTDAAVVDTNVARVLARVAGRPLTARQAQRAADRLLPLGCSWEWNQSAMELGATVCTAAAPRCGMCPTVRTCAWRGEGADPARTTAGVSRRQPPFEGSDRQARGRLLRRLVEGAQPVEDAPEIMGRRVSDAARLVDALVAEGLCAVDDGWITLPATRSGR